ncbi:MAG TPA: choice-of-anchor D domain-containing protein [Candidatus Kapabacteria bacterium]|nr:choice-of-anchor D domain-containing protein [Candidatus Kapabacteria bacterium]
MHQTNRMRTVRPLLLLLILATTMPALAQRLTIARLDTSKYPTITALVYPLDRDGRLIEGLDEGDFRVLENGSRREIISMRCSPPPAEQPLSSVLAIDVSGSMAHGGRGGAPNMELARAAAGAWIDGLPEGSESALTIFDHGSMIVQDFTSDRDMLRAGVLALTPNGGTNYDAGLLKPPSGALAIAAKGASRKVVIFLTDGRGRGSEREIVDEAQRIGATIFCVTLGMPAPEVLVNIARRTGGEAYENVSSLEEARAVYRAILFRASGGDPCEITWRSLPACTVERELSIEIPSSGLSATDEYEAPASSVARLDIEPPAVSFGMMTAGSSREMTVTLTAVNRDVTVSSIAPLGATGGFSLVGASAPFTLRSGERRALTVRFDAPDSLYHFARWRIDNDACFGGSLFASAGIGNPPAPSIRVVHPNGGERLHAGEIAEILWDGVRPSDTVRIDYSTDAGTTWRPVASRAGGLAHRWRVPATPSERCLMRIAQVPPGPSTRRDALQYVGPGDWVIASAFSPDGRRVAAASWDGTASIWDVATGRRLQRLVAGSNPASGGRASRVYHVEFSADGSRVLTADEGSAVRVWDVASGRPVRTFDASRVYNKPNSDKAGEGDVTPERVLSPDGRRVALMFNYGRVQYASPAVFDVDSGRLLFEIPQPAGVHYRDVTWSPDGATIAVSGSDSTVTIRRVPTGEVVRTIAVGGEAEGATWSPDGSLIATLSREDRGMADVWNVRTGEKVVEVPFASHGHPRALFHPDGSRLLVWGYTSTPGPRLVDLSGAVVQEYDQDGEGSVGYATFTADGRYVATSNGYTIKVYDTEQGTILNEIEIDAQASHAAFSPDGTRIAGALGDTLGIWPSNRMGLQQDVSDSLWAIVVETKPVAIDVDFGRRAVGVPADSVVEMYIRNDGTRAMTVESIRFGGASAREYSLVSGIPPFAVGPGEARAVEFEFTPARVGPRRASVVIEAGGTTLEKVIRGEGVEPQLRLGLSEVDFDSVEVGDRRDSLVTVAIENTGEVPVDVTRAVIAGPDSTQFEIVDGGGPFTIAPGASHPMTLRFSPNEPGRTATLLRFEHAAIGADRGAYLYGEGIGPERYPDPTTFRTIVTPNAIIPKRGRVVAASYDVFGLMAGYVPIDNVMVMAGGAVPLPDDWGGVNGTMYAAYGLGLKAGVELMPRLNVAGGLIWGRSTYDNDATADSTESVITTLAPFAAISYGDDDSRISASAGYAMKTHEIIVAGEIERNAMVLSLGGDYRIADRWKVCAEVMTMESLGHVPIAVTARWFGRTWALDAGLAYVGITTGDAEAAETPVLPMVSWVMVF